MRAFSLRRSLCTALLVAVTAFSSYADLSSQQLQNLLNSIGSVYDILNQTQNNQGKSSAWYLQNIRDIIQNPMADLQASAQSQSASLTSLLSELQAVRSAVESESSDFDDTDLLNGLNSLQSSLQTMQGYLASLDASVSALSSTNDASGLDLQGYFSQVIDALSNLQTVFDGSIEVTGELTLGEGQTSMLRNISFHTERTKDAVYLLNQSLNNFIGSPGDSLHDINPGGNGAYTWFAFLEGFIDMFQLLEQQFEILGYRLLLLTQYAEHMEEDFMPSITNSLSTYLPFLTNQTDDLFFVWFSNQVFHIPGYPSSPSWHDNADEYRFARIIGMLLAQNYGLTGSKSFPSRTSILQVPGAAKSFFTSGTVSPTEIETLLYSWSEPLLEQRRWMYTISNTVPYIEGLPRHRNKVGGAGDTWTGSFGDLEWSSGDIQQVSGTPNRTPWNNQYLATDYFADLLKFLASTNLVQNASYGDRIIEALGGSPSDDDITGGSLTNNYVGPVFTNLAQVMTPAELFPTEVDVSELRIGDFDSFESEAIGKISTGLSLSGTSSGQIVLFPAIPDLGPEFTQDYTYDFSQHFTSQDREYVRGIFSTIWHVTFYVFSVFLVYNEVKSAVQGS